MPNRIIKESICTSENLNQLSPEAENLFYRLIVKADDFGCYFGNVKIIKNTCYPLKSDAIKDKKMIEWLNELIKAELIFLYNGEDGKQYIKFTKWEKHQQKRATKPKFPLPKSDDSNCNQLQSNVPVFEISNSNRESRIENAEPSAPKLTLSEFKNVKLTEEELKKLYERFGQEETDEAIEEFGSWMKANGKTKKTIMQHSLIGLNVIRKRNHRK